MTTKANVDDFLSSAKLAIVGVSRSKIKFGNSIYRELKKKGYQVIPVNPNTDSIESEPCFPSLTELPEPVDGAVIVVPPAQTETVVRDAAKAGIKKVWMQQGAESVAAVKYCEDNGILAVHGECILMFADPTAFHHKMHRWVWKLLGKTPK